MAKPAIIIGDGKFATKDTKFLAHAQGDSSSRFVARELTYDRGSNVTATRVLPNGLIEKGRENKAHYSNNFAQVGQGGGWGHSGVNNISTGQDGYDGTTNATAVFASTVDANHQVFLGNVNSAPSSVSITDVFTLSVHVKPNGYDHVMLRTDRTQAKASFNISTGVVGTKGSECVASSMTAVGNGFYRCQATFAPVNTVSFVNIAMMEADDTNEFTGNTSKGYIIQDAQWELGLVATDLIPTSGAAGKAGILEDQARVDYLSNSNGYLLMEPTRQNKITVSEYYGGWQFSGNTDSVFSFTQNHDISPDGTKNASRYSATVNYRSLRKTVTLSTSTNYVFSFYVKNIDATRLRYRVHNVDTGSGTGADVISSTSYYSSVSTSEWTRIEVPFTTDSSGTSYAVYVADGLTVTSSGDSGGNVLFWGGQVEEGSFATSYIPTHGTAASRSAEGLPASTGSVIDMSSFMKGEDVTLVVELAENSSTVRDGSEGSIRLSNGDSQAGSINIYRASASATTYRAVFFGTSADSFGSGVNSGAVIINGSAPKIAISRDKGASSSTFTIYVNGSKLANADGLTDSNGQFTNSYFQVTMDDLQITGEGSLLKLSKLKLFDSVLSTGDMKTETE